MTFLDSLNNLAQEVRTSYYRKFEDEVLIDLLDELSHSNDHKAVLLIGNYGHKLIQQFDTFESTQAKDDYLGTFYAYPVVRHYSYPSNCFIIAVYGDNHKLIRSCIHYFEGDSDDLRTQQS